MATVVIGARADVELCTGAANTADGLPSGANTIAGARHPDTPLAWDGDGDVPFGWSDWRPGAFSVDDPDGDTAAPSDVGLRAQHIVDTTPPSSYRGQLIAALSRLKTKEIE